MVFIDSFVKFLPVGYLAIAAGLIWELFIRKNPKNLIRPAVIVVLALEVVKAGLLVFGTYYLWSHNAVSKLLLPPQQKISYFVSYVSYRFVLPFLFALGAALLFFFFAKIINRFFKERLFYADEPLFIFYGIIITGHPLWIFYIFLAVIAAILLYFSGLIFKKLKFGELFSLYYLWPVIAFLVLLFNKLILQIPLISSLKL